MFIMYSLAQVLSDNGGHANILCIRDCDETGHVVEDFSMKVSGHVVDTHSLCKIYIGVR